MSLWSILRTAQSFGLFLVLAASLAGCDSATAERHLASGQQAFNNGELQAAVIELKHSLKKNPDSVVARALLGRVQLRQGSYADAENSLQRAVDLGDSSDATLALLLRARLALGKNQAVIGSLEERAKLPPALALVLADGYLANEAPEQARPLYLQHAQTPGGQYGLGVLALAAGEVDEARAQFLRAAKNDPLHAPSRAQLAELALLDASFADAARWFTELEALPDASATGSVGLVRIKILQGDLEGAQADLAALRVRYANLPILRYLQGLTYFQQGAFDAAEESLLEVFQLAPDHSPSLSLMGTVKYGQGQFLQAEDYVNRYRANHPQDASAAKLLASLQNERGDIEGLVATLEPFEATTDDAQLLGMLGSAYMRIGRFTDSTAVLQRAVALAPDLSPFRNQLALSLLSSGDRGGAEAQLELALDRDDSQFESDYLLAMLRLQQGDIDGAFAAAEAMLQKDAGSPMGHHLRGGISLSQGDSKAARAAFVNALELDAAFVPSAAALAELHIAQDDIAAAESIWQQVLDQDASSEPARLALARLALAADEPAKARELIAQAASQPDAGPRSRIAQLRILLGNVDLQAAQALAADSLQRYPNNLELLLLDSQLMLALGEPRRARATALKVDRLADHNQALQPIVALALGEQLSRVGEYEAARRRLTQARAGEGEVAIAAQVATARTALAERDLDQVEAKLATFDRAAAQHPLVRLLWGDLYASRNQPQQARKVYQQLAREGMREGLLRYVGVLTAAGEQDVAQTQLRAWLQEHQADRGSRALLANLLLTAGSNAAATAQYEALMPNEDPVLLNNLAHLYYLADDPRAEVVARSAYDRARGAPEVADTLGWILVENGNFREAVSLLRDSADKLADNGTVHYHLGVAYARLGDPARARQSLERALSLADFPESAQAQQELGQLN